MDIRKPKAIHSFRELLVEIGIIVVGVGIALAGEQAVETWREHRQYAEARQAMFDELSGNLTNIRNRLKYTACTVRRMQEIDAILDRAESGKPFETPSWIGPSISFRMRFIAESEAQKSTLFTSAEQRNFGSPYSYFHSLDVEQDRERVAWGRLQMLQGKSRLSPEMIQALRDALADAQYENYRIAYLLDWAETWGRQIGLQDLSGTSQSYARFFEDHPHCLPMNTPTAEAERKTALHPPARL